MLDSHLNPPVLHGTASGYTGMSIWSNAEDWDELDKLQEVVELLEMIVGLSSMGGVELACIECYFIRGRTGIMIGRWAAYEWCTDLPLTSISVWCTPSSRRSRDDH